MRYIFVFSLIFLMMACAGTGPKPEWNATEYYKYAKSKYDNKDYFDAVNEFTVVLLRFSGSTVADSAQYYLADSHFKMGEYLIAAAEFEKLINNMNRSPLVPKAQFMMAQSYDELSPRAELDQQYTEKALRQYQIFIEDNPTDPLKEEAERKISKLRDKMAKKQLANAEIYRKMGEYRAAIIYFDDVLAKYYDTAWADDAEFGKIQAYMDSDDYDNASKELDKFEQQFPESDLMPDVNEIKENLVQLGHKE